MATGKKWLVITGGPSSGKTTTLLELKKLGYIVCPEAARVLIDREIAKGKTLAQIRKDEAEFQRAVLEMKIANEKNAPHDGIVFFDRGLPDSAAYFQLLGLEPDDTLRLCRENAYEKVFLLEQLPFEKDYSRTEDDATAEKIRQLLKQVYQNLGYDVISIPAVSLEERINLILTEINQ